MKLFNLALINMLMLSGCSHQTYKVEDFSKDDLIWFKPFSKTDTVVFISQNTELDTIVFKAYVAASDSTRNYRQGFSNTKYLTVPYYFTRGSYHQFAVMSDGKTRYSQDFVNAYKSSAEYGSLEIAFIGTLFSDSIKNIQELNDTTYFFDSKKADYSGMNVEKEIKSFTFNIRRGITEFTDDRNFKWVRK